MLERKGKVGTPPAEESVLAIEIDKSWPPCGEENPFLRQAGRYSALKLAHYVLAT